MFKSIVMLFVFICGCGRTGLHGLEIEDEIDGGVDSAAADGSFESDAGGCVAVAEDCCDDLDQDCDGVADNHCESPPRPVLGYRAELVARDCSMVSLGSTSVRGLNFVLIGDEREPLQVPSLAIGFQASREGPFVPASIANVRLIREDGTEVGDRVLVPSGDPSTALLHPNITVGVEDGAMIGGVRLGVEYDIRRFLDLGVSGLSVWTAFSPYGTVAIGTETDACGVYPGLRHAELIAYPGGDGVFVSGSEIFLFRSVLRMFLAHDSPGGLSSPSLEQVVASFVAQNPPNDPESAYDATLKSLALWVASTIHTNPDRPRTLRVYRDAMHIANLIAERALQNLNQAFAFSDDEFQDVVIAAGTSRRILVTLDTSNAGTNTTVTVGIVQEESEVIPLSVLWSDGVTDVDWICDPPSGLTLHY